MPKKKLVVFTGAGISAESGLQTFRDADGLWNNYRIEEVANPRAFARNPKMVLDFYNMRRNKVAKAKPNEAHLMLAQLEKDFDVCIITQNIDDLHERAGSTNIIHLHGEINKMRTVKDPDTIYPSSKEIYPGDLGADGSQLRPHIVWFEEAVPMFEPAVAQTSSADIFLVIGTSLQVYPAASLLQFTKAGIPVILVNKEIPEGYRQSKYYLVENTATAAVPELWKILREIG